MTLHLFLTSAMIICALIAVMIKRTIHAAIFLAILSVLLALVMFGADAPWAGVFELSVCAGLITVLFASTASMVGRGESYAKNEKKYFRFLPVALIIFGVCLWMWGGQLAAVLMPSDLISPTANMKVGDIIWTYGLNDLLGQLCIFVAGVLTVRIILGEGSNE